MDDEAKQKLEDLLDALVGMVIDAEFSVYENQIVLTSIDSMSELIK